jgi:hypothetical protein
VTLYLLRSELLEAPLDEPRREFCSYCSYPPSRISRRNAGRVCARCNLGMILQAPADGAPRQASLFLILDGSLVVQGVSRGAETVLLVEEPDGVNTPLSELLMPAGGPNDWSELTALVGLALAGTPSPAVVELRTVGHPILWFAARVSSCGPPPAALLLLSPIPDRAWR